MRTEIQVKEYKTSFYTYLIITTDYNSIEHICYNGFSFKAGEYKVYNNTKNYYIDIPNLVEYTEEEMFLYSTSMSSDINFSAELLKAVQIYINDLGTNFYYKEDVLEY